MLIEWNDSFATGVQLFDEQHKKLFGFINSLNDIIVGDGRGKEAMADILDGLVEYTMTHFAEEERLMEETGFSGYAAHRAEHEALIEDVLAFQEKFLKGDAELDRAILDFLIDWLKSHIAKTDKAYGPHLVAKGIRSGELAYMDWDASYSVGVKKLDEQHKKLFRLAQDFFKAIENGEDHDAIGKIFDGLVAYTRVHFADEEEAMLESDYPLIEDHRAEHRQLLEKVLYFNDGFRAGNMMTVDIMDFLGVWLKNHVATADKGYGPFIAAGQPSMNGTPGFL